MKTDCGRNIGFYLGQRYVVRLRPLTENEGGGWLAEIPDLPGCMSDGGTPEEALSNLDDAKRAWLSAVLESGRSVPLPLGENDEYSGRVTLRIPKTLHRDLARTAEKEQTSLNQLLVSLLSFAYGSLYRKARKKLSETMFITTDMQEKTEKYWKQSLEGIPRHDRGLNLSQRSRFRTPEGIERLLGSWVGHFK